MTEQYTPNLGDYPDNTARRDAVHVPVAPMIALAELEPGQFFATTDGKTAFPVASYDPRAVGYVDPMLARKTHKVLTGQMFWGYIFPGTVISLRHVWRHPAFEIRVPSV